MKPIEVWRIVLILILMEHAQRGVRVIDMNGLKKSLNPYFNGTCSKRRGKCKVNRIGFRLNPYFNGTCSKRRRKIHTDETGRVLILILMEHAQRALAAVINKKTKRGLNPYFNGTCSKRFCCSLYEGLILKVLILILMEHAQRVDGRI